MIGYRITYVGCGSGHKLWSDFLLHHYQVYNKCNNVENLSTMTITMSALYNSM